MKSPRFGRRFAILATVCLAVMALGAATVATVAPSSALRFQGPFWTTPQSFDSLGGGQVGGETRTYLAGATLLVGDVVYLSANNTVNKSASASNHEKVVGVVVGGRSTGMLNALDSADVGTTAATVGRPVVVLRQGRAWVMLDTVTATDTIHAGDRIKPSTGIAGRVRPATASITATAANPTYPGGAADTSFTMKSTSVHPTITAGAITVAGDGFTKIFGTGVRLFVKNSPALIEVNAK